MTVVLRNCDARVVFFRDIYDARRCAAESYSNAISLANFRCIVTPLMGAAT